MSVTGEVPSITTMAIQAITAGSGLLGGGVLLGLLDRWLKSRADARGDQRSDSKELDDAQQRHLANVERARDQAEEKRDEARKETEGEKDRADLWERTARWWNDKAHSLGHAVNSARAAAVLTMERAGKTPPENWERPVWLPPLREPWTHQEPAPPLPGETPAAE